MPQLTHNHADSIHADGEESSFFGTGVSEITELRRRGSRTLGTR